MKHNSVWGKLLLLALSFVLAFSTLVSCTKDDIAALDKENDEIKTELGTTEENLAKLETLVNSIKVTADAAATKDALEAAKTALEAVKTTADAAATAAKLEEVKTALETALAGKADSAVKAELQAAIAAVKTTADAAATAAKLEEAKTALEAAIAGKADKAALEEAAAKIAALEEDAADLAEVTEALEAALEGKATKTELAAVEAKLADYAKAADVTALQNTLNETKAKVEEVATDLSALLAEFNALKATTTGLEAELEAAQAAIAALQADDFAAEYKAATETLYVDSEENEYSLVDWDNLVNSVNKELYTSGTYAQFLQKANTLRFFLNRALTVEEIKSYFAELVNYKANEMETFEQTLEKIVLSYECGGKFLALDKDTAAAMTEMDEAYVGATNVGLEDATLDARYTKIAAAYDNLEAAEVASEAIEALIATVKGIETIVYEDSKEAISNAVDAFTMFEYTYFQANAQYLEYYEAKTTTALAAALVKDYADMVAAEARYYELCDAWDNRVVLSQVALGYNTARPTYDKAESLAAELAAVEAWIAKYELEEVNVAKIYFDEYALINAASTYANAMAKIYTDLEVAALNARIAAVVATDDSIIYSSLAEAKTIRELVTALGVEIAKVNGYEVALDGNFVAMVGDLADFAAVETRIAALVEAKNKIDELDEVKYAALFAADKVIGISDYDAIVACRDDIAKICEEYNILTSEVAESNYQKIVAEIQGKWDVVAEDYKAKTNSLLVAYKEAMAILGNEAYNKDYPIAYANQVIKAANMVTTAITTHKVGTAHVKFLDEETANGVNFIDLLDQLYAVASNTNERATAAETAFVTVKSYIDAIAGLNYKKLDNKKAVDDAYLAIAQWVDEYLDDNAIVVVEGETKINEDVIIAAVAAVQGAKKYDGKASDYEYKLLASTVLEAVCAANATMTETHSKASAAWGNTETEGTVAFLLNLYAGMVEDGVNVTYTIHTDFAVIAKAYADYRAEYYNENSAVYTYFAEDVAYAAFESTYNGFKTFYDAAVAEANRINAAIDAIENLNVDVYNNKENAAKYLKDTEQLIADIANFNATYDKNCACNEWFKDNLLALYKAYYIADAMNAAFNKNIDQGTIFNTYVNGLLANAESIDEAKDYWNTTKEHIANL